MIVVRLQVAMNAQADLPEVARAAGAFGLIARRIQRGQHDGNQQCQNGDHDQQLHQREAGNFFPLRMVPSHVSNPSRQMCLPITRYPSRRAMSSSLNCDLRGNHDCIHKRREVANIALERQKKPF